MSIMKFFKLLYYYYYSFYQRFDDEPHAMTVFALGVCQSFPIIFIVQIAAAGIFCRIVPTWYCVGIGVLFIGINHFAFIRSGLSRRIVSGVAPMIVSSQFSKALAIAYLILSIAFMSLGPILAKLLIENCH